MKEDCSWKRKR